MNKPGKRTAAVAVVLALIATMTAVSPIFVLSSPPRMNILTNGNSGSGSSAPIVTSPPPPVELTSGHSNDMTPAFRPAGNIVFSSDRSGSYQIWTANPDGSHMVRLTYLAGDSSQPTFSPDGKKIAFVQESIDGSMKLWVMNADGSGLENVTRDISSINVFSWSPSEGSNKIAHDQLTDGKWSVDIAQVEGRGNAVVNTLSCSNYCFDPSWSPNGEELVYVSAVQSHASQGESYNLTVGNLATGKTFQILNDASSVKMPRFSDDGSNILFLQAETSVSDSSAGSSKTLWDLFISPAIPNGTSRNLLQGTFACPYGQAWTPQISEGSFSPKPNNATEFLFSGSTLNGIEDLYLVNYNASFSETLPSGSIEEPCVIEVDRLTNLAYSSVNGFGWSLDSAKIVYAAVTNGTDFSHIFVMTYVVVKQPSPYGP